MKTQTSDLATSKPELAGNTATGLLKLIAIISMIIDHSGVVLFPECSELRLFGRLAFPLFAWCMVVGSEYTSNFPRYLSRILILMLLSQPFYMLALNHSILQLNIFATLFLGLAAIYGVKMRRFGSEIWAPALAIMLSCIIQIDYGWTGVVFILLLYAARKTKSGLAAFFVAFCLFWAQSSGTVRMIFGVDVSAIHSLTQFGSTLTQSLLRVQFFALLALPLILIPMKCSLRLPKWFFYAVYPAHLLLIYLIKFALP